MLEDLSEAWYTRRNMAAVIETIEERDPAWEASMVAFFRRIGIPHVCMEVVVPALEERKCLIVAGVRRTPWPPWGFGARRIHALCQVWPVAEDEAGLGNVFVIDDDITNIGLQAAVYREALQQLAQRGIQRVSHVVMKGAILANRILTASGFEETEDIVLTDHARYKVYRASLREHMEYLGLDTWSTVDLLTCEIDESAFDRISLLLAATNLGTRPYWTESSIRPELIPAGPALVASGSLVASPHGPPGPDPGC